MAPSSQDAVLPLFADSRRVNDPETALALIAGEARGCTRCPLYRNATQTVFGEGPAGASLMLVGEQPGDQEDLAGPSLCWTRRQGARPGARNRRHRAR